MLRALSTACFAGWVAFLGGGCISVDEESSSMDLATDPRVDDRPDAGRDARAKTEDSAAGGEPLSNGEDSSAPPGKDSSATPPSTKPTGPFLRIAYLIPSDRTASETYRRNFESAVKSVQYFFNEQLGGRTFALREPLVEMFRLAHEANWYSTNPVGEDSRNYFWFNVAADAFAATGATWGDPNNLWVFYIDAQEGCGQGYGAARGLGVVIEPMSHLLALAGMPNVKSCPNEPERYDRCFITGALAHELAHACGLGHPPGCDTFTASEYDDKALLCRGYATFPNTYIRPDDASILNACRYIVPQTLTGTGPSCSQ